MTGPRFISTLEWAALHVRLDGKQFRPEDYPLMIEPARAIDEGRGKIVGLFFPPQVFKTLLVQLNLLRTVCVEPERAGLYMKTGEETLSFSSEKLAPLVNGTPIVSTRFPSQADDRGGLKLFRFTDAPVSLLAADVRAHRNSRSLQTVYLDEAWQYEKGAMQEIFARTDSFGWRSRKVIASTGSDVDDETDTLWQTGERWEWHGACPSCNAIVPLEVGDPDNPGGLKWPSDERTREPDGRWKIGPVSKLATWQCPACQAHHEFSTATLAHINDANRGARYIQTNPDGDPKVVFYRASAMPFRDWGQLAAEKCKAANARHLGSMELEEEFTRKRAMRPWDPAKLIEVNKSIPWGEYSMADPWEHEGKDTQGLPLRFLTVDVQQGHFWAVIRRWSNLLGHNGESRQMHFQKLWVEGEIEELRKQFNIHPLGVCLDSAYNAQAVYRICAKYGYLCTNGVKNRDFVHEDGIRRLFSPFRKMDPFIGTEFQGSQPGALEFLHGSESGKNRLAVLRQSKDINGKHYHTVARDAPEEYVRQAWGEAQVRKRDPRGGWKFEWKKLRDNHAFDCEVMQVCLASMYGILSSESMEQVAPDPVQAQK